MKQSGSSPQAVVSALIMPNSGESDDHVMHVLVRLGVEVRTLAPGFLSATGAREALRSVESIARIEEKTEKQMRRGGPLR